MTEAKPEQNQSKSSYSPPKGTERGGVLRLKGKTLRYNASADWLVLRRSEHPAAEMFHVYYRSAERRSKASKSRPLTFVFNGGPGAASAYLHVGAVGPKRAVFGKNGTPPPPPSNLVDNQESWLQFSDLVFIDPIGTGFSRSVAESANAHEPKPLEDKDASKKEQQRREYYQVQEDLRSLGEFITKFLSTHGLWGRPVFIAGESYGGFRVAKLSRILQEQYGVAIHGAILISPALELNSLNGSPYDVYPWLDLIPSYAAAATFHGKSSAFDRRQAFGAIIASAEKFAVDRVSELYLKGDEVAARTQSEVLKTLASYVGLSEQVVKLVHGQITIATFQRELLRDRGELIGLYDASTALIDPFPHNAVQWFGDPTMAAFNRVYTTAINAQLRQEVGLVTNRDYLLLSGEVNQHWKLDDRFHAFHLQVGSADELRFGLAVNPFMGLFVAHGVYDLVTPYATSARLLRQMHLRPEQKSRIEQHTYAGGHMFYSWDRSRIEFFQHIKSFYLNYSNPKS